MARMQMHARRLLTATLLAAVAAACGSSDSSSPGDGGPPQDSASPGDDASGNGENALTLNYFWPQNYVTQGPAGSVQYDDMVVATVRVGCLTPAR
jgi:ABC-type glycerol-3-phosphate transport system substrate-binding protein